MIQYVYSFSIADAEDKTLLGGKGAGLAEMTQAGLPVPPGFIITTDGYRAIKEGREKEVLQQVSQGMRELEAVTGRKLGKDLLISVRSGAPVSMPGMMETILNVGAYRTEATAGPPSNVGMFADPIVAYRSWLRFLTQYARLVMGMTNSQRINNPIEMYIKGNHNKTGHHTVEQLTEEDWMQLVHLVYVRMRKVNEAQADGAYLSKSFQLGTAIHAIIDSWQGSKAQTYRAHYGISEEMGTAIVIQAMVFGNKDTNSGTGVLFTRNPSTGERELYGEYLVNAQGEDVVSGEVTPEPLSSLAGSHPEIYATLVRAAADLEKVGHDAQDIEFTVESGTLYLLQRRAAKRTAQAAVVMAFDMLQEGLIDEGEAANRVTGAQLKLADQPTVAAESAEGAVLLGQGLPASPGVVTGVVVTTLQELESVRAKGLSPILVRELTTPDDVALMMRSAAVLTQKGGMTSHAAVVARELDVPCVAGLAALSLGKLESQEEPW